MRTIIVDDDPLIIESEKNIISKNEYLNIVGEFYDGNKFLESLNKLEPDVVFLDIEMPFMNGFELLSKLEHICFNLVFVTAYNQFAINAFKFNAVDYLVKPINVDELKAVVEKVESKIIVHPQQLQTLQHQLKKGFITKIAVPAFNGITFIDFNDIIYAMANGNYTDLLLTDNRKVLISKILKDVQEVLEEQHFLRIHRQYIINLNHIKLFNRNEGQVTMINNDVLLISRRLKDELISYYRRLI